MKKILEDMFDLIKSNLRWFVWFLLIIIFVSTVIGYTLTWYLGVIYFVCIFVFMCLEFIGIK